MRLFIGYGYNSRDIWIEKDVFPILEAMGMEIVHGKDMHGESLQDVVKDRIDQADALLGFCTLRANQETAEFNTHTWVRDEMVHALAQKKPVVEVREKGVKNPPGLIGDRQRIALDPENRLSCIAEVVKVVSGWSMRRLQLVPSNEQQSKKIHLALISNTLIVRYRTRIKGVDSKYREGRIDRVDQGLYLNAIGLPDQSFVEIVGSTQSKGVLFNTGWASADLVRIYFN
jgi:hypothetical protein